jgi:hypothetical protein
VTIASTVCLSASVSAGLVVPPGALRSRASSSLAPAAGVAVTGAERGDALLAEPGRRGGGGVAGEELQRDGRLDVGEDCLGAGPVHVQQRGELVGRGDAHLDQVGAGADRGAQGLGLVAERDGDAQLVLTQPQVLSDHQGVAGVGLGAGDDLSVAPGLDRVGADRHDRVTGFEQGVDEPAVGSLDPDRDVGAVTELAEPADQVGEPVGGVSDGEGRLHSARVIKDARVVGLGRPVDPDIEQGDRCGQKVGQGFSLSWQQRPGEEAGCRAVTDWRSTARPSDAGLQPRESRGRRCHAGPRGATTLGRHPDPRRVRTTSIIPMPARKRVHQ